MQIENCVRYNVRKDGTSDETSCLECKLGFGLDKEEKKCEKLKKKNCLKMDETSTNCSICAKNMVYRQESGSCVLQDKKDKILKCDFYKFSAPKISNSLQCFKCKEFYIPTAKNTCTENRELYKCLNNDPKCLKCDYRFGWWAIGTQSPPSNDQNYQLCEYNPWTDQSIDYSQELFIELISALVFTCVMSAIAFYYWIVKIKGFEAKNIEEEGRNV